MEKKWWEQFKQQCPKCRKYNCYSPHKETKRFYYKKCSSCGFTKKKEINFAEYRNRKGKTYLKNNVWKKYIEVELIEGVNKFGRRFIKISPVENRLI